MTNGAKSRTNGVGHSPFVLPGRAVYNVGMELQTHPQGRNFWQNPLLRHLVIWLLPIVGFYLLIRIFDTSQTAIEVTVTMFLPAPVTVYLHFFALKRLFETRRQWLYAASYFIVSN